MDSTLRLGLTPGDPLCGNPQNAIISVILSSWQDNMLEYICRESPARSQIIFIREEHPDSWVLFFCIERKVSLNDKKTEDICR